MHREVVKNRSLRYMLITLVSIVAFGWAYIEWVTRFGR